MSNYTIINEGGAGGGGFEMQTINSIGLRAGTYVDQITINGVDHGGDGGVDMGTLKLAAGEFITNIVVRAGLYIDYVEFNTNFGNQIKGGGTGGAKHTISGTLIAIDGRSGSYVDQLNFLIG